MINMMMKRRKDCDDDSPSGKDEFLRWIITICQLVGNHLSPGSDCIIVLKTLPLPLRPLTCNHLSRSLKHGPSIWRWHVWQITRQDKYSPGKKPQFWAREPLRIILNLEEAVTGEQSSCQSRKLEFIWWQIWNKIVRFAVECPAKITPHVAPPSMSVRWRGGGAHAWVGSRQISHPCHPPLPSQPSQPVNIFAGFFFALIGSDTVQNGVGSIWQRVDVWMNMKGKVQNKNMFHLGVAGSAENSNAFLWNLYRIHRPNKPFWSLHNFSL